MATRYQARVVIPKAIAPLAEEIKEVTGMSSLSEAVTLLITRYGPHLIEWWKSNPHSLEGLHSVEASPADSIIPAAIDLSTPIDF